MLKESRLARKGGFPVHTAKRKSFDLRFFYGIKDGILLISFLNRKLFFIFVKKEDMDVQINNIGALIRYERIRRGMTQEELGLKVGVGKAQISKIESGKGLTIKTVTKVLDALDLSASVKLTGSKKIDKRLIGFVVAVIHEFAKANNLTVREASNYLNRFRGLEFLTEHYEAEHLLSLEDSVEDLTHICYNNGGGLR